MAMPVSLITVRTSAKSTLISPGRVISSAMPCTAPCSPLFAALKASSSVVLGPSTVSSFWFGMVISESTFLVNSAIPWSATSERLPPSLRNGLVTTPHASGDEQHVAALDHFDDAIAVLHRRLAADLRIGAGAQALGDAASDL